MKIRRDFGGKLVPYGSLNPGDVFQMYPISMYHYMKMQEQKDVCLETGQYGDGEQSGDTVVKVDATLVVRNDFDQRQGG